MRIRPDTKLDFSDVLIEPKRSTLKSRKDVDLKRTFILKHTQRAWSVIPIVAANMDTVATFEMSDALLKHDCVTALHKHYSVDELARYFRFLRDSVSSIVPNNSPYPDYTTGENNVFYSLGISEADLSKLKLFESAFGTPQNICIDVANGYTERFVDIVKRFRDTRPNVNLMVGNVVTAEMTEELIFAGADIVKVGIGPGSVCTTRKMTGVGYPQLSAVMDCADAAHGLGGMICSDGGCTSPGDVSKAFGAGADLVMLGGMLAGHDESGGEKVYETIGDINNPDSTIRRGKVIGVKFYGMSSDTAMDKHSGGVAEYRASEGKTVMIPYRGSVNNTIRDILGGVRSTCTYVGASKLKELSKRTTFIRVNNQLNQVFTGKEVK
jgi:GMP reductase